MRIVKIKDFLLEDEPVNWLIDGLLPDIGWTLFYGMQGIGKSTFAIQMCDALQHGKDFLGMECKQTSIVYVQADSVAVEWREIIRRVCNHSMPGFTIVDVPERTLGNPRYVEYLQGMVAKYKPGFVVFDSLYNLTAWSINTEQVLLAVNAMKGICGAVPWLLVHHPPHSESRAAGHHVISGNCSNLWGLLKTKLKIEKGRLVKNKELLLERDERGLWVIKKDDSYGDDDFMNRALF